MRTPINGDKLGSVGFQYLGVPYSKMDCQAFVEKCLADCGLDMNLAGSNAWYREVNRNGWTGTPEECTALYGGVPNGAFLFILKHDNGEPQKYKADGLGNASHIGICTGKQGEGAIHSSSSRGCVCESKFKGKTIPNGGWNRVGLWDMVDYIEFNETTPEPVQTQTLPTLRKGSKGEYVTLLQTKLIQLGYSLPRYGADGDFGAETEAAVKAFQKANGLEPDGIVGSKTWETLTSGELTFYTVTVRHVAKNVANEIIRQYGGNMAKE